MERKEIEALAYEIADDAARIEIESLCVGRPAFGPEWLDIANVDGSEETECVDRAVRYLECRGRLKHHPDNPELVKVCGEEP